ncbi:polysaccharide pyruvyl transferase family protein [Actinomarinicola tropica]|uniref:Glycosyltransferase n=1 Tax=Actinomarinicola tropica TaxID=2789776 RepID=A0A5Q2RPN4_9ACTN|nr:polysaccharide pyruvyl transferase family protein [Actinomarinicola tropica]QGG95840.1 glycosyltransferase [Actinomarinicola tropica]
MSARDRAERIRRVIGDALASGESGATAARIDEVVQRINHELQVDLGPRLEAVARQVRGMDARAFALRDELLAHLVEIEGIGRGQAAALREILLAPDRDEEAERLRTGLPPRAERRAGLSIVTISWNHGRLLPAAVRSARALLESLDPEDRGEIWILDDGSNDDTADVLAGLERDDGVHALRSRLSLGLSRARDVLLHAVPTRHALVLDADNTVLPSAAALHRHARAAGAAFTFGPLLVVDPDGAPQGLVSAEPPGEAYLTADANSIDTMAVIDVDAVLAAGGYTRDPLLAAADDWELVHRLARTGHTIGFVPEVVGRYRLSARRMSAEGRDSAAILHRIERAYRVDGLLDLPAIDVRVAHPAPPVSDAVDRRRRVVVVSGGGVANVGDDAILQATIERLVAHPPADGWAIDLVTDGADLPQLAAPCAWLGSLADVVADLPGLALDAGDLVVFAGGGGVAAPFAASIVAGRAALARAARDAGARVVAAGQGVGPISADMADDVRDIFGACERIGVRDPLSQDALHALGIGSEVVADDAVALVGSGRDAGGEGRTPRLPEPGTYLLVHVRVAQYNLAEPARWKDVADAIDALAAERGLDVVGVVINDQGHAAELDLLADLARPDRRARWHLVHATSDAQLAVELCAGASAALVGSYHLAYFALLAGRPTALVVDAPYFDAKAAGLAALLDLPPIAVGHAVTADELAARWDDVGAALHPGRREELAAAADRWWAAALA